MVASLLSWPTTHAAAVACAALGRGVVRCGAACAGEGVPAARARAAGAAVPAKTPLRARAATVMTATAAATATARQPRVRRIHSLIVVARTRPHDGSDTARLPGAGLRGTLPTGTAGPPGRDDLLMLSNVPPGDVRRLS